MVDLTLANEIEPMVQANVEKRWIGLRRLQLAQDLAHRLLREEGVKGLIAPQLLVAKMKEAQTKGQADDQPQKNGVFQFWPWPKASLATRDLFFEHHLSNTI